MTPSGEIYVSSIKRILYDIVNAKTLTKDVQAGQPAFRHLAIGMCLFAFTFSMYALGGSAGSVVTGAISDGLALTHGDQSLAYALAIVSVGLPWASAHFWWSARKVASAA